MSSASSHDRFWNAGQACRPSRHRGTIAGVVKDVGGFRHPPEGGLASGQIIHGPHPGEDPIGDADRGGSGRHPAADLRHQLDQADLA